MCCGGGREGEVQRLDHSRGAIGRDRGQHRRELVGRAGRLDRTYLRRAGTKAQHEEQEAMESSRRRTCNEDWKSGYCRQSQEGERVVRGDGEFRRIREDEKDREERSIPVAGVQMR